MTYKDEQEAFVSNLNGSNIGDFILCLALLPVSILLLKSVQGLRKGKGIKLLQDVACLVLPITLGLTLLSDSIGFVIATMLCCVTVMYCVSRHISPPTQKPGDLRDERQRSASYTSMENLNSVDETKKRRSPKINLSFITYFRGGNMLLTCLSILAIDFYVYPRRFGKTELFGFSLMDSGAGTFVIASALTSKFARDVNHIASSGVNLQYLVVFGLGVGRMVIIKAVGYQEHVSEYGTTWNFFVTLCAVWLLADLIHKYCGYSASERRLMVSSNVVELFQSLQVPLLSFVILGSYQYFLTFGDLTEFISNSSRTSSFLAANREGIFSLCGYTPMYLLSEWFSSQFFFNQPVPSGLVTCKVCSSTSNCENCRGASNTAESQLNYKQICALVVSAVSCAFGWYWSSSLLQPTSRRLTNLPFVLMILMLASLMLTSLIVVDMIDKTYILHDHHGKEEEKILCGRINTLDIMSKYQLVVFMFANLLTGIINMSIQTLYVPDRFAFCIIFVYMSVLVVACWLFMKSNLCS